MALTIRSSQRIRAALVAVAMAGLGAIGIATSTAAGAATPAITVTPSTGLSNGQTVTVHGTGYDPNVHNINVIECPVAGAGQNSCNVNGAKLFQSTDASGSFTVSLAVVSSVGGTDCTKAQCMIDGHEGTSATSGNDARVILQFGSTGGGSSGGGSGSTGGTSGTGSTGGTGTGGTGTGGTGTGGQPTGAPTGHEDLGAPRVLLALVLAGAGVVLLAGGGVLHLRRSRPGS
jgi:hypothetical protein